MTKGKHTDEELEQEAREWLLGFMKDLTLEFSTTTKRNEMKNWIKNRAIESNEDDSDSKFQHFCIDDFDFPQKKHSKKSLKENETIYHFIIKSKTVEWSIFKNQAEFKELKEKLEKIDEDKLRLIVGEVETIRDKKVQFTSMLKKFLNVSKFTLKLTFLHEFLEISTLYKWHNSKILFQGNLYKKLGGYYVHSNCTSICKKALR